MWWVRVWLSTVFPTQFTESMAFGHQVPVCRVEELLRLIEESLGIYWPYLLLVSNFQCTIKKTLFQIFWTCVRINLLYLELRRILNNTFKKDSSHKSGLEDDAYIPFACNRVRLSKYKRTQDYAVASRRYKGCYRWVRALVSIMEPTSQSELS